MAITQRSIAVIGGTGVLVLPGDLDDANSLYELFRPAHIVYLGTHFWKIRGDPRTAEAAAAHSVSLDEMAMRLEEQQYQNVFDALARTVNDEQRDTEATGYLERVVINTLPSPGTVSDGKYPNVYHFESRARGLKVLQAGAHAGKPGYQQVLALTSYIYLGVYLQSFFNTKVLSNSGERLFGPKMQSDGRYLLRQVAHAPFKEIPMLCPPRDMRPLVQALAQNAPAGTHLLGGQPITIQGFAARWGEALRVSVRWEPVAMEEMLSEAPTEIRDFLRGPLQSSAFVTEYGFDGGQEAKWPSELGMADTDLVDLTQWIKESDWTE